jgi:5-methylcytosine-specific restriction endonuclease McrA
MPEKMCTACGVTKPISDFAKHTSCKGGVRPICKACGVKATLEWKARNPQKASAQLRRQRGRHPEQTASYTRAWRQRHPEANRAKSQRYYARKMGAVIEDVDSLAVCERDNWTCQLCGEPIDRSLTFPHPESATVDHVIPLNRGGAHAMSNVQLAHMRCNSRKADKVAS